MGVQFFSALCLLPGLLSLLLLGHSFSGHGWVYHTQADEHSAEDSMGILGTSLKWTFSVSSFSSPSVPENSDSFDFLRLLDLSLLLRDPVGLLRFSLPSSGLETLQHLTGASIESVNVFHLSGIRVLCDVQSLKNLCF